MLALELVLKILVGMIVGFILYKIKLLNNQSNATLSRLLAEVVCPFMIFANVMAISGQDLADKADVYRVLITGVVIYVILVPASILITKLLRVKKRSQGVVECLLIFGNIGFIGLPVAESLYGPVGVFFMAVLNIHFNFICYSYGLWLVTKDAEGKFRFSPKRILNPSIIGCSIALILFLFDFKLPDLVLSPISFIGNITSPLSMIVLGSSIASHDLKRIFSQWRMYAITFIRMILFPLITFFLCKAIFGPGLLTNILTFHMGTPAAVITSMFAMAYGGDEDTATSGVAMMNIFCIITIPCIYFMTTHF